MSWNSGPCLNDPPPRPAVTIEAKSSPVDPGAVLETLAAYWAHPVPARFTNRVPGRIAGSAHDQLVPEGTANPYWEIRGRTFEDLDGYRVVLQNSAWEG